MSSYVAARTVEEALCELAGESPARPVAGGTDLVVGARQGKRDLPRSLVGIHAVAALRGIVPGPTGLQLGALTVHAEIVDSPAVVSRCPALADASAVVGSPATRYTGTIGGNVMNASPAMDTGAPLLVHGATVELVSPEGTRTLPISDLWVEPGVVSAAPSELLTRIDVPTPRHGTGSAYVRLEYRRAMEIAVVGAAAMLVMGEDEAILDASVAITALAPTIRRVPAAEAILSGQTATDELLRSAASAVADAAQPIDDVRATSRYRRAMAAVVARRALEAAQRRARKARQHETAEVT